MAATSLLRQQMITRTLAVEAAMSSDMDDLSMRLRDELRGTEAGHDPWAGVRLMRFYEERGQRTREHDESPPPATDAADDDGRIR